MIKALGYTSIPMGAICGKEAQFDAVVNTVPAMILPEADFSKNCIAMELASLPGMSGDGIISARGLPARLAPKESGKLIAETFLRLAV
jgi:hypothetical protein